jgi:hypothetical protein
MGKRAAAILSVLTVVVLLIMEEKWLTKHAAAQGYYMVAPQMAIQQRAPAPQMMTPTWDYEVVTDTEDVQRRVVERLFRKQNPLPEVVDVSEDVALQMAAKEVRDIARSFGRAEGDFADKWLARVMSTEDPKARLDILDECFIDLEEESMGGLDCKGLDFALRRFRLLLAPHTARVKNAKQYVRSLEVKLDRSKRNHVEAWMKRVERGAFAEDASEVLDECLISSTMGGARSPDCLEFEDALRNYKSASDVWAFQP